MIGVVGAAGGVGRAVVAHLTRWLDPGTYIRAGGRDVSRLPAAPGVLARAVDVTDAASLEAFCAGCETVVNCAGPAVEIGATVAAAAFRAGAAYVDPAGDDDLLAAVAAVPGADDHPALVSAGMMPGLSALFPAYLAEAMPGATRLTAYVGGLDGFTRAAAVDFLGAADGEPLAAWRDGARRSRALAPQQAALVPFFDDPVLLQPYLSVETEHLARRLGLTAVDWYSAFAGSRVPAALGTRDADLLCRAAELDAFGRTRYQMLVFELAGPSGSRVLACRGTGASALTGAAAALGALAVTARTVPPGVRHLADAVDPAWAVGRLRGSDAVVALHIADGTLADCAAVEEGVA